MQISKKGLWSIILVLAMFLALETYVCRNHLRGTFDYYKNKIVSCYNDDKTRKEMREKLQPFLSSEISQPTVVIFEPNPFHHECIPGYTKYFTDLGYNVDVLITAGSEDSLEFFEPKDKLKIFTFESFDKIKLINSDLAKKFTEYDKVLLHTAYGYQKDMVKSFGLYDNPNSLFVMHNTGFIEALEMQEYEENNRTFVLAEFDKGLYVNPNYFGEIPVHHKNKKTRFFITSTSGRKYDGLVQTTKTLKDKNLDFEIIVVGRTSTFSPKDIPDELKDYFIFKHNLSYIKMYEEIMNSDYILILLDPENPYDDVFRKCQATGSAQLAYGFSKPIIIHESFSSLYKFNSENAFIYTKDNLTEVIEKAISLNPEKYSIMCNNVKLLCDKIYKQSLSNVKKALGI